MLSGIRKNRNGGEYVFIDGKAMTADEAVRIELSDADTAVVPGQAESASVPGAQQAADAQKSGANRKKTSVRQSLDRMERDGLELRDDAASGSLLGGMPSFLVDDRAKSRKINLSFGIVLLLLFLFSLCVSANYHFTIYSPADVIGCYAGWFSITSASISDVSNLTAVQYDVWGRYPMYFDVLDEANNVVRYVVCGAFLALAGALYQNAFRNPIAAPTMLGVSSGINIATLVMVMVFGYGVMNLVGYYYLFAYLGGVVVLLLVIAGGKWVSGKGSFNVVNMLLMGTVITQLVNVVVQYVQTNFMDDATYAIFYSFQNAVGIESIYTYISIIIGGLVAVVPIILLRFRLNLVSFSDDETRLLGVNPTRLRMVALVCGSLLMLTAQVNAGQVAMISLVVPFVVRAVFGAEFRRQLAGNLLVGAILMLVCNDVISYVSFGNFDVTLGMVVSVVATPLFVWMVAVRQRAWE